MRVTYGFVFYFTLAMAVATFFLSILLIKAIRHQVFAIERKYKFSQNQFLIITKYIIFAIIIAILADSVVTYRSFSNDLSLGSGDIITDKFDQIKQAQKDDYVILFRKYREFYMAERNFMLTSSALFVYYVFIKFLGMFGKLSGIQQDLSQAKKIQQNKKTPEAKS